MKKLALPVTILLLTGFAYTSFTAVQISPIIPPYPGNPNVFLDGTAQWSTPGGSGGGTAGTVINTVASAGLLAVDASKTNGIAATKAHITNAWGIFTGSTTTFVNGNGELSTPADTAANWTAVGTTNSSLSGVATVNGLVVTNGITVASPIKQGASGNLDLWAGSSAGVRIMKSDGTLSAAFTPATDSLTFGSAADTQILRDGAANTLALRNSTAAQTFRVYNTYTDASNYERLSLLWSSNLAYLTAEAAGTGTPRVLTLKGGGIGGFGIGGSTGGANWWIDSSGNLKATDNSFDIGASGATRPRTLYLGNQLVTPYITVDGNGAALAVNTDFYWAGRSHIASASDGIIKFVNNANTDFNRLQFGGTSASFPALKRNATGLDLRLADDTDYGPFASGAHSILTAAGAGSVIVPEAANTLSIRNGTNAQALRVYNTYTDASNYEMGFFSWAANSLGIGTSKAGSGSDREIGFWTGGSKRWTISATGNLLAGADNAYDIGASGATRPKNIYASGFILAPTVSVTTGVLDLAAGSRIDWAGQSRIYSSSDGVIKLANNANADFGRLQFGGTTASFPSIKRNAAAINFRLADDSSDAAITAADITSSDTIAFTAKSRIRGSITDGNIRLSNAAVTDFGLLQFGGTSSSFPAVKRSGTQLQARLADDSDFTGIAANQIQSGVVKVLTDAAATSAFYIAVANTNTASGHVVYTVSATDGTDTQAISGDVKFASVGKATAVTAQIADVQTTAAVSAGTLSCTVTANVSTNNVLALQWNADTSLTTTNLVLRWRLETPSTYTVNPL